MRNLEEGDLEKNIYGYPTTTIIKVICRNNLLVSISNEKE